MPTIIALTSRVLSGSLILICMLAISANIAKSSPIALRIATFNIEDIRSADLETPDHPRLKEIAAILQQMRPNIVLLSEIANRQDDSPSNADRFVNLYLSVPQGPGLKPIKFTTYTPPTNTGLHSGIDLDHSGSMRTQHPPLSNNQTPEAREYANDCFGFGTFPGQYAMALLVDPKLNIEEDQIRTFQKFLWKDLPDFSAPTNPDGSPWYLPEAWEVFRLSSKNFADIPVTLPNGTSLHVLIAHPTPPAFDGPEGRNKRRNHDEIKLIRLYIDNNQSLIDDQGLSGGLGADDHFVILGDLNADPTDGSSLDMVMLTQLLTSTKLADDVFPSSQVKIDRLDSTDTSMFRLRVDYVLPSSNITITRSGIWRKSKPTTRFPSDHFPVWLELIIP